MFERYIGKVLPGPPDRHPCRLFAPYPDSGAAVSRICLNRAPARIVLAKDHTQFVSAAPAKTVPQTPMAVWAGTPVSAQTSTFGAVRTKTLGSALL